MWNEILSAALTNGLWAALFCGLLVYELTDSRKREGRYTRTIGELSDRLGMVKSVKADTETLKVDTQTIKTEVVRIGACKKRGGGIKSACGSTPESAAIGDKSEKHDGAEKIIGGAVRTAGSACQ